MASAEQLLNEAQFAFHRISVGDASGNRRHTARARALCKRIFRKYPGSTEASVAHGIMMRLGDDTPLPKEVREFKVAHESHAAGAVADNARAASAEPGMSVGQFHDQPLDWAGMAALLFSANRIVLAVLGFFGLLLYGFLGNLLWFLLLAPALIFTVPARGMMPEKKRRPIDLFVVAMNGWIAEQRNKA